MHVERPPVVAKNMTRQLALLLCGLSEVILFGMCTFSILIRIIIAG